MANQPKWIKIETVGYTASGRTCIWSVKTIDETETLGEIRWFGRWRRYAFYPRFGTVFEKQCLRDLADFCEVQTARHTPKTKDI